MFHQWTNLNYEFQSWSLDTGRWPGRVYMAFSCVDTNSAHTIFTERYAKSDYDVCRLKPISRQRYWSKYVVTIWAWWRDLCVCVVWCVCVWGGGIIFKFIQGVATLWHAHGNTVTLMPLIMHIDWLCCCCVSRYFLCVVIRWALHVYVVMFWDEIIKSFSITIIFQHCG